MSRAWLWIERLDAASSLWSKIFFFSFGGFSLTGAFQAIIIALNVPLPEWWIPASASAVSAMLVGLVAYFSRPRLGTSMAVDADLLAKARKSASEGIELKRRSEVASAVFEILSATWGNVNNRESRLDVLFKKSRNALVFFVNNDELGGIEKDPAPGDDDKYVEIEYRIRGKIPRVVRAKQGEWICIPGGKVE